MEPVMLNDEIQISGLDLFRVMTEEEMICVRHDKKGICVIAPDLHTILTLAWKKEGGLFSKVLGGNDPVADMEECYRKSFKLQYTTKNSFCGDELCGTFIQVRLFLLFLVHFSSFRDKIRP